MPTQPDNAARVNLQLEQAIQAVLSDRPIAYHASLARALGSVTAGVLLSQFLYWQPRSRDPDGWFWKTQVDIAEETALSRTETETARRVLVRAGVLEEKRRGVPAKMHFRVNLTKVVELLSRSQERREGAPSAAAASASPSSGDPHDPQFAGFLQTRLRDSAHPDRGDPANQSAGKAQTITESTAQTTTENTSHITDSKVFEGQSLHINDENLHFREKGNFENLEGEDERIDHYLDRVIPPHNDGFTTDMEMVRTRRKKPSQSASERRVAAATRQDGSITRPSKSGPSEPPRAGGRRGLADQATPDIAAVMSQLSDELHDDAERSSLGRAVRLWQQSKASEGNFIAAIYAARKITRQQGHVEKRASGEAGDLGLKNRVPYFFSVLEDQLGLKQDTPTTS